MPLLEIIKTRRSIRAYKSAPVEKEKIDQLIEALIWAPSAGNLQARKFYFIQDKEIIEKIAKLTNRNFEPSPPLLVVCCLDKKIRERYGERGEKLYAILDVAASIENMMLLATDLGLGTLWMGAFEEEAVQEILKIPENLRPVSLVPVGYAAKEPEAPKRLGRNEAVEFV